MTMDPLEARNLFPITEHYIYMNHAGVAPMSERARAAVLSVTETAAEQPLGEEFWNVPQKLRESIATLINAEADSISLVRSTAHAISLLAGGLDWEPGDNVVGARGEYPANVYPWLALKDRGVEMRFASNAGGRVEPESVLELVDGRTRVVALSQVEFWNGYRVDLETIGRECRRRGVILAVDAIQSAGVLQLDMEKLPVDFLAAGSYNPGPVLEAIPRVGLRGFESRRTFDHVHLGHTSLAESTETCVRENALVMEKYAGGFANNLVRPCVNIVGLGRVSDALIVKSKELADKYGAILNMHQCAFPEEVESIRQRTGRTPIKQLEHLGALGPNVVLVHMLHVTDEEIEILARTRTQVVHNPGTALKIVYGLSKGGKFPEMLKAGVNVALGTDAGDCANFMDMVRAMYLAALLFKDIRFDPGVMGAETALEMATINGAKALGMDDEIGSLEPGKKADVVLFDADTPEWQPLYCEPYNLVYSASGGSVDTVIVDGKIVMEHREVKTIDEREVIARIRELSRGVEARSGVKPPTRWPIS